MQCSFENKDELLEDIEEGLMGAMDGGAPEDAELLEIPDNIWSGLRMAAKNEGRRRRSWGVLRSWTGRGRGGSDFAGLQCFLLP